MERARFEKLLKVLYPDLIILEYYTFQRYELIDGSEFKELPPSIIAKVMGSVDVNGLGDDFSNWTGIENITIDKY